MYWKLLFTLFSIKNKKLLAKKKIKNLTKNNKQHAKVTIAKALL
jgi:hypothetical protein